MYRLLKLTLLRKKEPEALMSSQRTTTTFWPLRSCLATIEARRPRRWPLPSMMTGAAEKVAIWLARELPRGEELASGSEHGGSSVRTEPSPPRQAPAAALAPKRPRRAPSLHALVLIALLARTRNGLNTVKYTLHAYQ